MTPEYEQEIAANLERAEQSIQAAKYLAVKGYHDFAASRAYYAAFYGATAVLLNGGLDFSKHSGVIASIHQRFVKTGKLSKEQGKDLNWLFEIRNVGDYGGTAHVYLSHKRSGRFRLRRVSCVLSSPCSTDK
jgi:uncharacterized protein (UPF0332 family)